MHPLLFGTAVATPWQGAAAAPKGPAPSPGGKPAGERGASEAVDKIA